MHHDILATPTIAAIGPICPDERAFCDLVNGAASGTVITYHIGHLAYDRTLSSRVLDEPRRRALNSVANRALRLAQAGWVDLVQRRIDSDRVAYLAIVRRRPEGRTGARARLHRQHLAPAALSGPFVLSADPTEHLPLAA